MNTSNNTTGLKEDILTEEKWKMMICLPLALLYLVVMGNMFKSHRYSLEPIHIFELNIMVSAALLIINNSLYGFDQYFEEGDYFCAIVHFSGIYNEISFYMGVLSSQADRFLALYWNVSYKGRVTPELATKILMLEKLALFILLCVGAMFDPLVLRQGLYFKANKTESF